MILAKVALESIAPMAQGRHCQEPKLEREQPDAYEKRTWRMKMHVGPDGNVMIPALAIKNCLSEAAKFLSLQISGKGKATYTKHFEAGILVLDPVDTGVAAETVNGQEMYCPPTGRRGDGKRVWKKFPVLPHWNGTAEIYVLDEIITKDVFQQHLDCAGNFIGLGSFRVRNNGIFGRFRAEISSWTKV